MWSFRQPDGAADLAGGDTDQHQVHGRLAKPVLGCRRGPARQRQLLAVGTAYSGADDIDLATRTTTSRTLAVTPRMAEAWQAVDACFGRFCLTAGVEALQAMMVTDVEDLCGRRHSRSPDRRGHRWGHTRGKIGYQGWIRAFMT